MSLGSIWFLASTSSFSGGPQEVLVSNFGSWGYTRWNFPVLIILPWILGLDASRGGVGLVLPLPRGTPFFDSTTFLDGDNVQPLSS